MEKKIKVELSRGESDWLALRECFVRAFFRYPLFVYVMPNERNRKEFLRLYMEANYELAIRKGNAILICIKQFQTAQNSVASVDEVPEIVGGVMFIPPSRKTGGWENDNDQEYHVTYRRLGMERLDSEAYNRLIRYENWENENLVPHVMKSGIPSWNGVFCAIDTKLSGSGLGSLVYAECMKIMSKVHRQNYQRKFEFAKPKISAGNVPVPITPRENTSQSTQIPDKREPSVVTDLGFLQRVAERIRANLAEKNMTAKLQDFSLRLIHGLSMINHRHSYIPNVIPENSDGQTSNNGKSHLAKEGALVQKENQDGADSAPLVLAISHSIHAVGFHKKNGFYAAANLAYFDNTIDETRPQLNVHLLLMDPFRTGRGEAIVKQFTKEIVPEGKLRQAKQIENETKLCSVYDDGTK